LIKKQLLEDSEGNYDIVVKNYILFWLSVMLL